VEAPFAEQPARGQLVAGIPVHSLRLAGVIAKQEVRFGGAGEVLTVTHDTHSNESYRAGIRAALDAAVTAEGLTVGLDRVLGIGA
jgi:4-hydroxy-tetrahydrodipicolinate reductase